MAADQIDSNPSGGGTTATEEQPTFGYYLNSLKHWRDEVRRDLRIGERRAQTLHRIGSSCALDHDMAMAVRRRMLKVVEDALAKYPNAPGAAQ